MHPLSAAASWDQLQPPPEPPPPSRQGYAIADTNPAGYKITLAIRPLPRFLLSSQLSALSSQLSALSSQLSSFFRPSSSMGHAPIDGLLFSVRVFSLLLFSGHEVHGGVV